MSRAYPQPPRPDTPSDLVNCRIRRDQAAEADERAAEPSANLWEQLRADPPRAPEHIALAASEQHAPAAARWPHPRHRVFGTEPRALGEMARWRHVTLASSRARRRASAAPRRWFGPRGPGRAPVADGLLHRGRLRVRPAGPDAPGRTAGDDGLYSDAASARAALDGVGTTVAGTWIGSKLQRDEALATKLFVMVAKKAGEVIAGRMIPGFAIAFNSVSNRRETNALGRAGDQVLRRLVQTRHRLPR